MSDQLDNTNRMAAAAFEQANAAMRGMLAIVRRLAATGAFKIEDIDAIEKAVMRGLPEDLSTAPRMEFENARLQARKE